MFVYKSMEKRLEKYIVFEDSNDLSVRNENRGGFEAYVYILLFICSYIVAILYKESIHVSCVGFLKIGREVKIDLSSTKDIYAEQTFPSVLTVPCPRVKSSSSNQTSADP